MEFLQNKIQQALLKPFSIPDGRFKDIYGNVQLEYSSINNYRSDNYQRLDLVLSKVRASRGMNHRWKIHVFNTLGAKNPLSITGRFEDGLTTFKVNRTFVTVVPGFTYSINF